MRLIKKIIRTSAIDYFLLFEAIATSAVIRFIILFVPMRKFASFLGKQSLFSEITSASKHESEQTERIRLAIARTSRIVPWRCLCYEQAFTAKVLLKRRNIKSTIYFGVRKNSEQSKFDAHAWLRVENVIVTGKKGMQSFKEIACFS